MTLSGSRRGGIIAGLLVAGFLVVLALLATGVIVSRTVRVHNDDRENGADVSIETPGGRLSIRAGDHMDPSITGVPVYPGAYRVSDGGAHIEWNPKDGGADKNLYAIGGEFRTRDSVSQVVEFYRRQLPSVMIVSRENRSTRLEYRDGGINRVISIYERDGDTRIAVATVGGTESN